MSKKQKNIQSPAAPGERKSRRWLWIALAVALVIIAAVVGWYLVRYQFNREYRQYITEPAAAAVGTEFTALEDAEPQVEGYQLVAQNDILKLYADPATGCVAVYDLRSGETVYSNPPLADKDKGANKTNKAYLKSQLMVDYYNANLATGTYNSFADSVDLGNFKAETIPDGVRFTYELGEEVTVYYVPAYLTDERYQELHSAVDASIQREMYGKANSYYEQREDGDWYVSENGKKMPIRTLKKISDAFVEKGGMTPEEYYSWQEKAGVEVVETLGFTVALDWTLKGDGVECTIPPELIEERGGGMIYRIQLLPYMAAAGMDETGYMVVPNGSGSLINFNNGKWTNAQYSQYVYDMDLVDAEYTKTQNLQSVRLPIFAICRENSTVLASIEQGATFANITADVAGRNNSYNNAFVMFIIRGDEKLAMFGAGETADMPIVEDNYYFEPLTVRYTLLGEEYKGYSGVANYYRQRLIDEGVLTVKAESGDIPFYYDVIGGVKETAHTMGVQHLRVKAMTTFDQAAQMAQQLEELGVNSQVMNFQGWMNGGYYHDVANRISVLRQLGGKGGLENLAKAMGEYGEIYADVAFQNVTFISKRYRYTEESSRYYGAGYSVSLGEVDPSNLRRTSGLGYAENLYDLLSPKFLPYYVGGFTNAIGGYDETIGISLRDLGYELHADKKRTEVINREEALMVVESQLQKLRDTGRNLMITGGNDYALQGVSHILNAPMSATEYFIVDDTIPLYQMVVHGCVDYTGKPINTYVTDDVRRNLLEMVEYGASTRYIFTWEDATGMKYTGLNKYYATTFDAWAEEAVENYAYVNDALKYVSNANMVAHETLAENLKKVTYSNGVTIYVNYGAEEAQADGYAVPAMDYYVMGGVN
ncbi:MAG: hypothetical protein IJA77_03020 [Clostridia bacterium]|nr:hypothetical protein [Clostridia bacterium]